MKVVAKPTATIVEQLSNILTTKLPMIRNTGKTNDLKAVYPCPKAKGKAVDFVYAKERMKLSENLKVRMYDFTNSLVEND